MNSLKLLFFTMLCASMLTACSAKDNYNNTAATDSPMSNTSTMRPSDNPGNGSGSTDDKNTGDGSVMDDAGNIIDDSGDMVEDAGDAVGDAAKDVGDAVKN